jgi:gamma-glutamyltranspeptidase/glutathione hydrolase
VATVLAPDGMVATADQLATHAGLDVLAAGGSAADAAVAANAVLAVTAPHLCGMGGDLFALVHLPGEPVPRALNASGRAGSGANPTRLRAEGHHVMPGCVDGWLALHQAHGRLPLARVLSAAIGYARNGFPASPLLVASARGWAGAPRELAPARTGARVVRPGVADALSTIAADGRGGFYGGAFGRGLLALGAG